MQLLKFMAGSGFGPAPSTNNIPVQIAPLTHCGLSNDTIDSIGLLTFFPNSFYSTDGIFLSIAKKDLQNFSIDSQRCGYIVN